MHLLLLILVAMSCGCGAAASSPVAAPPSTAPATRSTDFLTAARQVTDYIQQKYWVEDAGLYAHSLEDRNADAMWGNGVQFSVLVAAAKDRPAIYRPVMDRFFASLDRYWDRKAKIPGY